MLLDPGESQVRRDSERELGLALWACWLDHSLLFPGVHCLRKPLRALGLLWSLSGSSLGGGRIGCNHGCPLLPLVCLAGQVADAVLGLLHNTSFIQQAPMLSIVDDELRDDAIDRNAGVLNELSGHRLLATICAGCAEVVNVKQGHSQEPRVAPRVLRALPLSTADVQGVRFTIEELELLDGNFGPGGERWLRCRCHGWMCCVSMIQLVCRR
mmetsp:Transcript_6198/g.16857  ORF Transcript_6198/g.16857 Transcript_6198/m.16857 type:complete len:212 (+) Transcript_6198:1298-1933(+)